MPKLSNEKKLEVIKDFLTENNIKYVENHEHKKSGALIPCYIPQHRIGIRAGAGSRNISLHDVCTGRRIHLLYR